MSLAPPPNRGQVSADGRYFWDGQAWKPVSLPTLQAPAAGSIQMSAGAAFKFGFFAFLGALVASVFLWIVAAVGIVIFGAAIATSFGRPTP
jgi:hypothetical protein